MKQDQRIEDILKRARDIESKLDSCVYEDQYIDRQEPSYYSARFIKSVLNGRHTGTS
jgi:hypothetical protein